MTYDEFKRLVADMRNAQREYFHTRSAAALDAQFYDQNCVNDAHLYIHAREVIDIVMRLVECDGMGDAPDVLHEIVEDAKRIMTEVK